MTLRTLAGALAAAAAFSAVAVSHADDAKPAPDCGGIAFTDKAGDQTGPLGDPGAGQDIVGGFFTTDENGSVFANIQISDLTGADPTGSDGPYFTMYYTYNGTQYEAYYSKTDTLGEFDFNGPVNDPTGMDGASTTAKLYTGKNGIVQIKLLSAYGGKEGAVLKNPYAESSQDEVAISSNNDMAPDSETGGKDYTATICGGAATPVDVPLNPNTPTTTTTAPAPTTPAKPAVGAFDFTLSPKAASAKVAKKKGLKLTLSSKNGASALKLTLYKGAKPSGKVLGKTTIKAFKGKKVIRIKAKKIAKGTVTLLISGKDAKGLAASAAFKIKVAK